MWQPPRQSNPPLRCAQAAATLTQAAIRGAGASLPVSSAARWCRPAPLLSGPELSQEQTALRPQPSDQRRGLRARLAQCPLRWCCCQSGSGRSRASSWCKLPSGPPKAGGFGGCCRDLRRSSAAGSGERARRRGIWREREREREQLSYMIAARSANDMGSQACVAIRLPYLTEPVTAGHAVHYIIP